jgi:hypothetical protein
MDRRSRPGIAADFDFAAGLRVVRHKRAGAYTHPLDIYPAWQYP